MPNPITPTPQTQLVGELATQFINNSRTAMGTLQDSINRIPDLRRRVGQLGGLRNIATQNPLSAETREIQTVLTSLENSLFVQRYAQGDLENMPSAQTLSDGIGSTIGIATGIKEHLDQCCDEITRRLIDLKAQLRRARNDILQAIPSYARGTNSRIQTLRGYLISVYLEEKTRFLQGLESAKGEWKDIIKNIVTDALNPISNKLDTVDRKCDRILQKIYEIEERVDDRLNTINRNVLAAIDGVTHIEEEVATTRVAVYEIAAVLDGYLLSYAADTLANKELITTSVASILAEVAVVEETLAGKVILGKKDLETQINGSIKNINEYTKKKYEKQDKFLKDTKEGFPYILTNDVCCNIVGESYARWDSLCSYFPTIVFVFNEVTEDEKPRRSQIKLRLNQPSAEITNDNIKLIIEKVRNIGEVSYKYGTCKGNYVSSDKRFKTTVFGSDRGNIELILTLLFTVIDEYFDPELLSTTKIGSKRPSLTKRNLDLYNIGLNSIDYNQEFTLRLKSVNLLVNGMKTIIRLPD